MKSYNLFGYKDFRSEKPDHQMTAKNKRLAVGAVKIMLDQYHCSHIDIMCDQDFHNLPGDQNTLMEKL